MQVSAVSVDRREDTGKGVARKLRAAGRVPGVIYGEGEAPNSITVDHHTFTKLMRAGAHHGLIDVSFPDIQEPVKALVREVQVHPVSRSILHVDLQRIDMQKPIRLEVAIVLVGKPEGVRNQGGILEHNLREVEVECLPSDIPEDIEVDVNSLQVGQAIHVSDLSRPGVTFLGHMETTVATVSLPAAERAAEEETPEAEAAEEGAEGAAPAAEGEAGEKSESGA